MFSRVESDGETVHKVDLYNEKNKDTCDMYLVEEIIGNKKYEKKPVQFRREVFPGVHRGGHCGFRRGHRHFGL